MDLNKMWENKENKEQFQKYGEMFTRDLGYSLFYGILSVNIIPGSAVLGAGFFASYSLWKYYSSERKDCYLSTLLVVGGIEFIVKDVFAKSLWAIGEQAIWPACRIIFNRIVKPIWETCLKPIVQKIMEFAETIFEKISNVFWNIGMFLAQIPLPTHPIWIGVACVVSAIAAYKIAVPIIFASTI